MSNTTLVAAERPDRRTWSLVAGSAAATLLLLSTPALAQTPPPQKVARPPQTEEAAPQGLLPLPEYSGEWQERAALTGDWGGTRNDWASSGFTLELDWMQIGQSIVSGGVDTSSAYMSNLDLYAKWDLMQAGLVPGGLINFRSQSKFGRTVNQDAGLLWPVNTYSAVPLSEPADDDIPFTITELNYVQFLSDKVGLTAGKITVLDGLNEFAAGAGRSQFMNLALLYSPTLAQVSPYSTLAVGGFWQESEHFNMAGLLMNLTDSSTTTGFSDIDDGTTALVSASLQYRLGELPGGATLAGAYAFNNDFARMGSLVFDPGGNLVSFETKGYAYAAFLSLWQYLFVEGDAPEVVDPTDGVQDLQGVGGFLTLNLGDEDTNPVGWSITGGLSGRGVIGGRDDDTCGLGYFYNDVQDPEAAPLVPLFAGSSQGLEAYYNFALARSTALSLDFQWVQSAFRDVDDAVILGARLNIKF